MRQPEEQSHDLTFVDMKLNRKPDIPVYSDNRVKLLDHEAGDYINASYIDSPFRVND
jgi:protein tyrosine phosphatase